MKKDASKLSKWYDKWEAWLLFIGGIALVVYLWYCFGWQRITDYSDSGRVGDSFGAVNALFTGLAFAILIVTLRLQMKELRQQQEEFKGTKEALQDQVNDGRFFQMLDLHASSLARIQLDIRPGTYDFQFNDSPKTGQLQGHEAIAYLVRKIKGSFSSFNHPTSFKDYPANCKPYTSLAEHLLLFMYELLAFIVEDESDRRVFYANVALGQLSQDELYLYCIYCYLNSENTKLVSVAKTLQIFKPIESWDIPELIKHALPPQAFGKESW